MRGRKALKVLAWIVGIFVVLLIAGYVTLRVFLPPEKLRALVLPRIEQALGQSVEVGPVHLAIWGGFGIGVEDIRIGNRPGYRDEHMLNLEKMVLRVPLRRLLRRELTVTRIDLVRPEIYLEKSAEGEINIAGLGKRLAPPEEDGTPEHRKSATPSPPATGSLQEPTAPRAGGPSAVPVSPSASASPEPGGLPVLVTLESVTVADGRLSYRDAAGFTADVRQIDYRAALSVDRALKDIRTDGHLSAGRVLLGIPGLKEPLPGFPVDADYRARVDLVSNRVSLDEAKMSVMGALIGVTGTVEDFTNPVIRLKTETSTDLSVLPLGSDVQISGRLSSDIRAEGPVLKPDSLNLVGTVTLDAGSLRSPQLPLPVENAAARILLKGQDIEIPNLAASLGSSSFRLTCAIDRAVPFAATGGKVVPTVRFDFRCPHLAADELIPEPAPAAGAPSTDSARALPAGKTHLPPIPEMNADGTVLIDRITAKKLEATDLRAAIAMAGNRLRVPEFSVGLYTGRIHGSAEADFRNLPEIPVSVSVVAEAVEANDFISVLSSYEDHLYGKLDLTGRFGWSGLTPEEIRPSLSGEGHATVSQGKIVNWDFARQLSRWIKFLEFGDLEFKNMDLDFRIAGERVEMHPLKLKALETWWKADGSVGFDESLDYRVTATLSAAATQSLKDQLPLPRQVTANIKQAEVVFFVTGAARSPKFRWDAASVKDQTEAQVRKEVQDFLDGKKGEAADALLKEVDKRVGGDAKDVVKDVLGGLLKPDSTDTTGQQQKIEDLKKESEKALKDLFGKRKKP